MEIAKALAEKARAAGQVREGGEFFSVTEKREVSDGQGGTVTIDVPNGKHKVVILSEKLGQGKSFDGKEQTQLQMTITDNGKHKQWDVPVKNADGTLYYLIEDLEAIELNQPFMVEAVKMKNGKYAKRISKVVQEETIPSIQLDDDANEADMPQLSASEDISPSDIPF